MRKYQTILRTLMAIAISFGVQTTASAQFSKLLKKAKEAVTNGVEVNIEKKAKEKAEEAKTTAVDTATNSSDETSSSGSVRNDSGESSAAPFELPRVKPEVKQEKVLCKVEPGEPGVVTIKAKKTGKVLGTYDRAAMKLTASDGKVYQFSQDGTVADADGKKIGSIDGQIFTSPRGEQLRCDDIGIIFVGKKNVGAVSTPQRAITGDNSWIEVSDKMNGVVLGYFVFAILYDNQKLLAEKEAYERSVTTDYMTDEEYYAHMKKEIDKRHGSSSSSSSGGGAMTLRKGGSIAGSIKADGTVFLGGSSRGKIDANGNIYVGGHIAGTLRSNGDVLKGGSIVGNIDEDSGNVRIKGSIVGGISKMTGDVRRNGSIIGKVEPVTDLKKAALYFFFGFW